MRCGQRPSARYAELVESHPFHDKTVERMGHPVQAIPWIVATGISVAENTVALARAFAVFSEDVGLTHLAKGLMKLYVCTELSFAFVDISMDINNANVPEETKKGYERLADAGMIFACEHYMLK